MDLLEQSPYIFCFLEFPCPFTSRQNRKCPVPLRSCCRPWCLVRDHPKCFCALRCRLRLETMAQGSVPRSHLLLFHVATRVSPRGLCGGDRRLLLPSSSLPVSGSLLSCSRSSGLPSSCLSRSSKGRWTERIVTGKSRRSWPRLGCGRQVGKAGGQGMSSSKTLLVHLLLTDFFLSLSK